MRKAIITAIIALGLLGAGVATTTLTMTPAVADCDNCS